MLHSHAIQVLPIGMLRVHTSTLQCAGKRVDRACRTFKRAMHAPAVVKHPGIIAMSLMLDAALFAARTHTAVDGLRVYRAKVRATTDVAIRVSTACSAVCCRFCWNFHIVQVATQPLDVCHLRRHALDLSEWPMRNAVALAPLLECCEGEAISCSSLFLWEVKILRQISGHMFIASRSHYIAGRSDTSTLAAL